MSEQRHRAMRAWGGLLCAFAMGCAGNTTEATSADKTDTHVPAVDVPSVDAMPETSGCLPPTSPTLTLAATVDVTTAAIGSSVTVTITTAGTKGPPVLTAVVERGGGTVEAPAAPACDPGKGHVTTVRWTLGVAPVENRLRVSAGAGFVDKSVSVLATLASPTEPKPFGDVHALLGTAAPGTTEDLAFTRDGKTLSVAVAGAVVDLDATGKATKRALTGGTLDGPLGLVYDTLGQLLVADAKGKAVKVVSPAGAIVTHIAASAEVAFVAPNDLTLLPNGELVVTDPCAGRIFWFSADGKTLFDSVAFDKPKEGGPNGVVPAPDGSGVYVTTENTAIVCQDATVTFDAKLAGLYRLPMANHAFGARETIATELGIFGDGLTFDAEGNLYVCVDRFKADFTLEESVVLVFPSAKGPPATLWRSTTRLFANVEFGRGAFGKTTLYAALLSVPPFTGAEQRGVVAGEVGIAGVGP